MTKSKQTQGKKNRQAGAEFERRVRADLESKGWFVSKFQNNVELKDVFDKMPTKTSYIGKMIPAKRKYNPFKKALSIGTGFPDFICWKTPVEIETRAGIESHPHYDIIGVECKVNGRLDQKERAKCAWLLENEIFNKILIAKKKKEGRKVTVKYMDFKEKYIMEKIYKIEKQMVKKVSGYNWVAKSINRSLKQASEGKIRRIA